MPSRAKPPTAGGLGRRIRRRTQELAAAFATLREATPRDRRDPAYRAAVALVEQNLADLEALGRELPGLLNQMRQAEGESRLGTEDREEKAAEPSGAEADPS